MELDNLKSLAQEVRDHKRLGKFCWKLTGHQSQKLNWCVCVCDDFKKVRWDICPFCPSLSCCFCLTCHLLQDVSFYCTCMLKKVALSSLLGLSCSRMVYVSLIKSTSTSARLLISAVWGGRWQCISGYPRSLLRSSRGDLDLGVPDIHRGDGDESGYVCVH